MVLVVLSSARKLLSRSVVGSSLAGDGLLVRLRSTSIALLGVVAAVGLGLIAFISQLGWPGTFNAPIPGSPAEAGTVHDAIALTRPAPGAGTANAGGNRPSAVSHRAALKRHGSGAPSPASGIGIDDPRQLATTGGGTVPDAPPTPSPGPEPESEPAAPSPVPTTGQPATVPTSPGASPEPRSSSQTAGNTSKSSAGADEAKRHSGPKSKPRSKSHGASSTYPTSTKRADSSPGKSGEEHGGGRPKSPGPPPASPKPSDPPVTAPPPKDPPEAPDYGGGKDEGGPGKSDWHRD
jgi:hypothetical protein